jgi:proline iminopeptidase
MDHRSGQKRAVDYLYPPVEPFDQRMVDMGDGHRIFVEQCGNPSGVPVLVLHGGPGGGCSPAMRRYFDPSHYRVVLFDQRGCGRSRPHASVEANTTWHLVADIERIRTLLGIDQFILFGGSWGATLALIYALSHPERVRHLVLRGVFLMTQAELRWFYGNAMEETRFARAWANWENALASVYSDGPLGEGPAEYARAFARLENHYFTHGGFLEEDGWIEKTLPRIAHIPAHIVQGRLDMICPPSAAWRLARNWPSARLRIVPLAGHALSEPGISEALVAAMRELQAG